MKADGKAMTDEEREELLRPYTLQEEADGSYIRIPKIMGRKEWNVYLAPYKAEVHIEAAHMTQGYLAALYLIRRLYPLRFTRTAMAFSLAAGMIPALYMQLACMYKATHILTFHILPGLLMVLVGAAIATLWQRRQEETNDG